jgi:cytochrome c
MLRRTLLMVLLAGLSAGASAQERGSKDEALAMANAAAAHGASAGVDQAIKDFNDKDNATWRKKDLYVVMVRNDGTVIAHGANEKLVGKNLMEIKDQNGKLFVQEQIKAAKAGGGWVDFEWPHPQTKKVESRTFYARKMAGFDGLVGVGAFR